MSYHELIYRIYPDDTADTTKEHWKKADEWINGLEHRKDFNEAVALAKLGRINCQHPFVVMAIQTGGAKQKYCDVWEFD